MTRPISLVTGACGFMGTRRRAGAEGAPLGVDFTYSNQKLKSTGYKFIYPDARDGLRDTVRWHKDQGWI